MKSFIFDIPGKIGRLNESADMKAILCNKTWCVYSDSGEKEVFIFMEDGTLVISVNGVASMGTWMYIPANRSMIINGAGVSIMAHPMFIKKLMVLVKDGTNECSFLIDQTEEELAYANELSSFSNYIEKNASASLENVSSQLHGFNNESEYLFGPNGRVNEYGKLEVDYRQIHKENDTVEHGVYYFNGKKCDDKIFAFIKKGGITFKFSFCSKDNGIGEGYLNEIEYENIDIDGDWYPRCSWTRYLYEKKLFLKTICEYNVFEERKKEIFGWSNNKIMNRSEWKEKYGEQFWQDILKCKDELNYMLNTEQLPLYFFHLNESIYYKTV